MIHESVFCRKSYSFRNFMELLAEGIFPKVLDLNGKSIG